MPINLLEIQRIAGRAAEYAREKQPKIVASSDSDAWIDIAVMKILQEFGHNSVDLTDEELQSI